MRRLSWAALMPGAVHGVGMRRGTASARGCRLRRVALLHRLTSADDIKHSLLLREDVHSQSVMAMSLTGGQCARQYRTRHRKMPRGTAMCYGERMGQFSGYKTRL